MQRKHFHIFDDLKPGDIIEIDCGHEYERATFVKFVKLGDKYCLELKRSGRQRLVCTREIERIRKVR